MAAEEETCHLVGAEPAPRVAKKMGSRKVSPIADVEAPLYPLTQPFYLRGRGQFPGLPLAEEDAEKPSCLLRADGEETDEEETKARTAAATEDDKAPRLLPPEAKEKTEARIATKAKAPRRSCGWLPRPSFSLSFPRTDGYKSLNKDQFRSILPPREERLAFHRKIVMDCLDLYNSLHPDDEYEPAPGVVTKHSSFDYGCCWTHGNFVARRKLSGCFNFLPAPRTIFFFELLTREDFNGVVTCIPLDEPVTEAYNFLGFPLGWRTRRDGRAEKNCKTCYQRCEDPPGPRKPFPCGHDRAEIVCRMCYLKSCVLHPFPGEFTFGYKSKGNAYN